MEPLKIYALCLGCAVGILLLQQSGHAAGQYARRVSTRFVHKQLAYPVLLTRPTGSLDVTRLEGLFIVLYVAVNATCAAYDIEGRSEFSVRLSRLCVTNMVLLYLGGRTNLFLDFAFRLPARRLQLIHHWIGRVCAVEGVIHGVLALTLAPEPGNRLGVPVSGSVALLCRRLLIYGSYLSCSARFSERRCSPSGAGHTKFS